MYTRKQQNVQHTAHSNMCAHKFSLLPLLFRGGFYICTLQAHSAYTTHTMCIQYTIENFVLPKMDGFWADNNERELKA